MLILALEIAEDGAGSSQFTPEIAGAEAGRVWDLLQAGTIRELYFRDDAPAAVLVLEAVDVVNAQKTLASLPIVAAGLISFEIVPLRAYPGFARLFGSTRPS
jgi:hypothetical protein